MKSIEIITPQNVVLQFELATLRDRVLAFVLDFIAMSVASMVILFLSAGIIDGSEVAGAVMAIVVICVFIFYSLAFEVLNKGRSLGKMALRIQVIKMAGGKATFSDFAARWVFRMIDIYFSCGAIASILIVSSSKGQRIGDVVANTAVVKQISTMNIDLKDLLAMHERNNYVPVYPQARKLLEEEALLIKSTLDRYKRFKNDAHQEALEMLAKRVREVLNVDNPPASHTMFLQTVLQDYVVLSR